MGLGVGAVVGPMGDGVGQSVAVAVAVATRHAQQARPSIAPAKCAMMRRR